MSKWTLESILSKIESRRDQPHRGDSLRRFEKAFRKWGFLNVHTGENIFCIAGTNGKGTVSKVLEVGLAASSFNTRVGLFTSPHLIRSNERIRAAGQDISDDQFVQTFLRVEKWVEEYELSHFEILTLMALDFFYSGALIKRVDFAVFEVGVGGLLDPTSVIPHTTAVITRLGFDHQTILGNSMAEIAFNKFGIVKKDNLVVHARLPREADEVLRKTAIRTQGRFVEAMPYPFDVHVENNELRYLLKTPWGDLVLPMLGQRSVENFSIAIRVLAERGLDVAKILPALSQAVWPGRMERFQPEGVVVPVYLSGDHNVQGIESLREILAHLPYKNIHVVLGIGQNKDFENMCIEFLKIPRAQFYLTRSPYRGLAPDEFSARIRHLAVLREENVEAAVQAARERADVGDVVLVTGSLYLVGYVRGLLLG